MTAIPTRLRFGVMCHGLTFPAWQAKCLEMLLQLDNVEPALLIMDSRPAPQPTSVWKKLGTLLRLRVNLFSIYNRYVVARRCSATKPIEMSRALAGVPRLSCEVVRKGRFSEYFREADLAEIRNANLDFMLRFGFGIIRGEILQAARFGVWSFHHGDEQKYRGAPPCFWEIYRGEAETGSILQRLTERLDGGVVLKKGWLPTRTAYPQNRDAAHFMGLTWPAEVCADIFAGRATYLESAPVKTTAPVYVAPTNRQMMLFAFTALGNRIHRVLHGGRDGAANLDIERRGAL